MSIPVNLDRDGDIIANEAAERIDNLEAQLSKQEKYCDDLQRSLSAALKANKNTVFIAEHQRLDENCIRYQLDLQQALKAKEEVERDAGSLLGHLREMEEGYRERCNYCGGDLDLCGALPACRAKSARVAIDEAMKK